MQALAQSICLGLAWTVQESLVVVGEGLLARAIARNMDRGTFWEVSGNPRHIPWFKAARL